MGWLKVFILYFDVAIACQERYLTLAPFLHTEDPFSSQSISQKVVFDFVSIIRLRANILPHQENVYRYEFKRDII